VIGAQFVRRSETELSELCETHQVDFEVGAYMQGSRGRDAMAEMIVRRGGARDIEPAYVVWWAAETARRGAPPPRFSEERVRGYTRRARASLLVAQGGAGGLVGMALFTPATSRPEDVSVLQMVFVSPERWGEGIGGRLVDAALAEARSEGYARCQLWTHASDERVRRLYEGRGFRRSGREQTGESGEQIVHYDRPL
jgi:ribosomal protein S18 acetylase RimI-like enzyme